jgi:hypothetical protein
MYYSMRVGRSALSVQKAKALFKSLMSSKTWYE